MAIIVLHQEYVPQLLIALLIVVSARQHIAVYAIRDTPWTETLINAFPFTNADKTASLKRVNAIAIADSFLSETIFHVRVVDCARFTMDTNAIVKSGMPEMPRIFVCLST